ncbi:MAG: gvpF [Solirubrobacterales bacterium]|nr:gvpF [Solirubrobacterales bacterium]
MTGHPEMTAAASATPQATSLYVYGVIPAADAGGWPGADGIDGPSATVRTVVAGELAALVSALPPDRIPGRRDDLEAHRRVLSLANERGTTIPMRFGIVIDSEDLVREELLARHAPEFTDLLAKLDGHVQMSVRAFYAEDALLNGVVQSDPEIARRTAAIEGLSELESRQERIELGELVATAVDARRAQDEQLLLDQLSPLATEVRVDPPGSERVALNAQLLVRRDRRTALDDAVAVLGAALHGHLALRYIGPLPPYSFAELSLEAGGE